MMDEEAFSVLRVLFCTHLAAGLLGILLGYLVMVSFHGKGDKR